MRRSALSSSATLLALLPLDAAGQEPHEAALERERRTILRDLLSPTFQDRMRATIWNSRFGRTAILRSTIREHKLSSTTRPRGKRESYDGSGIVSIRPSKNPYPAMPTARNAAAAPKAQKKECVA